jgi:hypothetical protein
MFSDRDEVPHDYGFLATGGQMLATVLEDEILAALVGVGSARNIV